MEFGLALFLGILHGIAQWKYLGSEQGAPSARLHAASLAIMLPIFFLVAFFCGRWERPLITGLLFAGWIICVVAVIILADRDRKDREAEHGEGGKASPATS